jgi:fucose 4-O-acetylase-like acetyltransferase
MGDSEGACWTIDSPDDDEAVVMLLQTSVAKASGKSATSCISLASRLALVFVMSILVLLFFLYKRLRVGKAPPEKLAKSNTHTHTYERAAHFDNAKFFCLALVVYPHWALIERWRDSTTSLVRLAELQHALDQTFWFHMPLFTMISGAVSGSFTNARLIRMIVTLVVPLLVVLFMIDPLAKSASHGESFRLPDPYDAIFVQCGPGPLWYVRCLVFWRLLCWLFESISPSSTVHMLFAILLGVCGVYLGPLYSDLTPTLGNCAWVRTATMAPFFFAGRWLDWNWLSDNIPVMPRIMICANWSLLLILCGLIQTFNRQYDDVTYQFESPTNPFASYMFIQSACSADVYFHWARYITDACFRGLLGIAFLYGCVPRVDMFITEVGANTMYAYVLHAYFLDTDLAAQTGKLYVAALPHTPSFGVQMLLNAAGILAACTFTCILSSRLSRVLLGWALQPTWLLPWLLPSKT